MIVARSICASDRLDQNLIKLGFQFKMFDFSSSSSLSKEQKELWDNFYYYVIILYIYIRVC
jgi:hypothetical protein